MIDPSIERCYPVVIAVNHACGHKISACTAWRWAQRGIGNVRLETVVVVGRRMTSVEAVVRFLSSVTAARDVAPAPVVRSPMARQKAIDAAERELSDAGI